MALDKILEAELTNKGVSDLVDRPSEAGLSATQLKAWFDKLAKEVTIPHFNALVDALVALTGSAEIGFNPTEKATATNAQNAIAGAYDYTDQKIAEAVLPTFLPEAKNISVEDIAGNFSGTNVEDVLAEMHTETSTDIAGIESDILALTIKVDGFNMNLPINLFDKTTVTNGYYIEYTSGIAIALLGYEASAYIPVTAGKLYHANTKQQMAFYTSSGYLAGATIMENGVVAPYNAVYARITVKNTDHDIAYFYESDVPNLFTSVGITSSKYVDYTTGNLLTASGYNASDYISIEGSYRYKTANNEQLAFYDGSKVFISGAVGGAQGTSSPQDISIGVVAPVNAKYIRLSVKDAELSTMALYNVQTIGLLQFPISKITVGNDADCDFTNINNAVAYAKANPTKQFNIHIRNGIYEEKIDLIGNNNISLIGDNVKKCIIIDKTGLYANSPLMLSGSHLIKNLTIIANHDSNPSYSAPYSYAVHCDYNNAGTILFENCEFYSYQNASVGIGLHQDQTIQFKNCYFYKDSTYDGGCVYWHNSVTSGVTNQILLFDNCTAIAKQGYALKMDDANIGSGNGLGNDMTVTYTRSLFYSETLGKNCFIVNTPAIGSNTIVGNVKISLTSYSNNLTVLNK